MIIKNITVINENAEILEGKDIFIKDGVITDILPSSSAPAEGEKDLEVIDAAGLFLSPGIPNLHVHTAMDIFKGIAEDCTADQWFNEKIFPFESTMTQDDVYLGTKLGIAGEAAYLTSIQR